MLDHQPRTHDGRRQPGAQEEAELTLAGAMASSSAAAMTAQIISRPGVKQPNNTTNNARHGSKRVRGIMEIDQS